MKRKLLIAAVAFGVLAGFSLAVAGGERVTIILYGAMVVCFGFMCFVPFVRHRQHQRWAKIQFLAMSLMAIGWGLLGFVRHVYRADLSRAAFWRLYHYETVLGSLWVGLWLGLVLSGQFFCSKAKQLHDAQ